MSCLCCLILSDWWIVPLVSGSMPIYQYIHLSILNPIKSRYQIETCQETQIHSAKNYIIHLTASLMSWYFHICLPLKNIYLPIYLPIYLSTHRSIYLSIYLPTYLSIYLSGDLPAYIATHTHWFLNSTCVFTYIHSSSFCISQDMLVAGEAHLWLTKVGRLFSTQPCSTSWDIRWFHILNKTIKSQMLSQQLGP